MKAALQLVPKVDFKRMIVMVVPTAAKLKWAAVADDKLAATGRLAKGLLSHSLSPSAGGAYCTAQTTQLILSCLMLWQVIIALFI